MILQKILHRNSRLLSDAVKLAITQTFIPPTPIQKKKKKRRRRRRKKKKRRRRKEGRKKKKKKYKNKNKKCNDERHL